MLSRRDLSGALALTAALAPGRSIAGPALNFADAAATDPTLCDYAPGLEYIKDHSFLFHDGWWHMFSISGTQGYYHGYNGNEETVSWSISRDLVTWEFRGHILHATQVPGRFDQHEIWAPFCVAANGQFYIFYTGVIQPIRPMEYRKLGHDHPGVGTGHRQTQGVAESKDLTYWDKVSDQRNGLGIPGRDSFVIHEPERGRYLLYSTIGIDRLHVAESRDLLNWTPIGICCQFPPEAGNDAAESTTVMRHPLTGQWILLTNNYFILSDDPLRFDGSRYRAYDTRFEGRTVDLGFACETMSINDKWYRSGAMGKRDYFRLGFTEIAWQRDGAFRVVKPSVIAAAGPSGKFRRASG